MLNLYPIPICYIYWWYYDDCSKMFNFTIYEHRNWRAYFFVRFFVPHHVCSTYWDYALHVNLYDIVYVHCHQQGTIRSSPPSFAKSFWKRKDNASLFFHTFFVNRCRRGGKYGVGWSGRSPTSGCPFSSWWPFIGLFDVSWNGFASTRAPWSTALVSDRKR